MASRVMDVPASTKPRSGLSPEQKAAFVLLLFLGLAGVFFGFQSFGANLRRPFEEQIARAPAGYLTLEEQEAEEMAALKTRDSDGDGLTDYDEQFVYKTSAYLQDSDSDGFDDKTEIFSGNDPNCPVGKTCGGVASPEAPAETNLLGNLGAPSASPPLLSSGATFQTEQDIADFLLALPVEQIREFLKQTGIPEADLGKLSDDELKQLFADAVDAALKEGKLKSILQANPPMSP